MTQRLVLQDGSRGRIASMTGAVAEGARFQGRHAAQVAATLARPA
jgi:hypothetical protein